ncbi:hypothetical protein HORIV_20420 [Vreelandella olivaria]|uniref:Large polyvalent protein-associated domain-containing protein n=1 Tax=Vreelandella olivaria TaxID=390919 RepID=A0ABN5WYI3_9GAMM|nr:hypothetical protein HORIV_20420 [Halomonas olivaria]
MKCFKAILLQPAGDQPSELFKRSAQMDKKLGQLYYSKPEELCARAFEAFVQDAAITNHFLVKAPRPLLKRKEAFTHEAHSGSRSMQRSAATLVGWEKRWGMQSKHEGARQALLPNAVSV